MTRFTADLAITLSLTIAGQAYSIPSGNVKSLELTLLSYGFSGQLSFTISAELATDSLFSPLTQNNLISVSLQVKLYQENTTTATSLSLNGLVTSHRISEQTLTNVLKTQGLMVSRHYYVEFADPAQVLWKQHYPCDLLTNSTLKALITAHTPTQITVVYDWDFLNTTYPMLILSLGGPNNSASFYDYLIWLIDANNGVLSYDYTNNQYTLSTAKNQTGQAISLSPEEVGEFGINFPALSFYTPHVLNAYSENPQNTAVSNTLASSPIRRDFIARYPIAADMTTRVTLETNRLKQAMHEVWVNYQQFPIQITPPGQLVDFKNSSAWNASLFVQANTYRVKEWRLSAQAIPAEALLELNETHSNFTIELNKRLESKAELCVPLPNYQPPFYPLFVEGKVESDTGEDTDATYQFYTDNDTSTNYYQVIIPLWNTQKVRVAYLPNMDTGQFYFPPYKNARVLIGLNFNNAYIAAFLDWGAGTALPLSSQGNQLVMGTSTTSQNIIKHTYVDSKPELQIQRTQGKDTELLQFSDGYIILQTQTAKDG